MRSALAFEVSGKKRDNLLGGFLTAIGRGDMEGLLALLAGDVVLYSDGGGRAVAVLSLVRGADNVARGILGTFRGYIFWSIRKSSHIRRSWRWVQIRERNRGTDRAGLQRTLKKPASHIQAAPQGLKPHCK